MRNFIAVAACALLIATASIAVAQQQATIQQIPFKADYRFHPFTSMPQPNYGLADGATVSVEAGCNPGFDKLYFNYQGAFNIDSAYDNQRCVLYLVGTAPFSEYLDAIASVEFLTKQEDFKPRRVTWTLGRGTFYNSITRNFYRLVPSLGAWSDALLNCNKSKPMGMNGYLATVTSADEMAGIGSKTNMSLWMGLMQNGTAAAGWSWQAGPEQGWTQWSGNSMYEGGSSSRTRDGTVAFNAWGRFQPVDTLGALTAGNLYGAIVPSAFESVSYWQNKANTDGVQGYVCEYDALSNPTLYSQMAMWTGSVLLEPSCSAYTTQPDCKNRGSYGCVWSNGNCLQTTCSIHATSTNCLLDNRCQWNTDNQLGRCVNRHCAAYASSESCRADPTCIAVTTNGLVTCKDAVCSDALDSCDCAKIDGCSWKNGMCGFADSIGCDGMDVVIAFDGTATMNQPFGKYTNGFSALTDMLENAQYYLTGTRAGVSPSGKHGMRVGFVRFGASATTTVGFGTNGRVSGDRGEVMGDASFLAAAWAPSQLRTLGDAMRKAGQMFADSTGAGRKKVVVVLSAGGIDDAASLGSNANSAYRQLVSNFSATVVGVTLQYTPVPTTDSKASDASFMALLKSPFAFTAVQTLDDLLSWGGGVFSICNARSTLGVTVMPPASSMLCREQLSPTACNQMSMCAWSFSAGMCVGSQCLQHCSSTACTNDPTCNFVTATTTCEELCPSLKDQTSCMGKSSFCMWDAASSACKAQACLNNPTEDACIADPAGCYYNASAPVRCQQIACETTDSVTCTTGNFGSFCSWSNEAGVCFRDACKIIGKLNRAACLATPGCMWDSMGMCSLTKCAGHRTETTCNFDFDCMWDITLSPPTCMPGKCTGNNQNALTAQTRCMMNASTCFWVPSVGGNPARCENLQCGMMTSSCSCSKLSQCVWRNGQCKDNRYVQCPAIDLVFAIEGTPGMNDPFGRHPDGFIGIMESIRSWARDAPMSGTNPSATGFRLAVSAYGPKANGFFVKMGVGAGNDLTGSAADFTGAGRMLSDLEATQAQSAGFSFGDVAVLPAVRNAFEIFKAGANNNRTKMLVIIGNNPITDGGAVLRDQIRALEAMGVQIFTNVVRRFSTITPLDEQAAMYMEPLASDTPANHFLFTTIDDLRATLLDQICDPSTNTGKALQISRDRTLPCSWLVGRTECGMQPTCMWDSNALPTCPLAGQCPNLGCVALPAALAGKFDCQHCTLKSGAFSCSLSNNFAALPGMCVTSPCASWYCNTGACNANSSCTWNANSTRCERKWCNLYTSLTACNADQGCVWDDFGSFAPGTCRPSMCWASRAKTSCESMMNPDPADERPICRWQSEYAPALCAERRCDNMEQGDCQAQPKECMWDQGANGRKCSHLQCAYSNGEECAIDANCFWNPYAATCNVRSPDCVITGFSTWTPCTAPCGASITYRARRIVQFPSDSRSAQTCDVVLAGLSGPATDKVMVQTLDCRSLPQYANGSMTWPADCNVYCQQYSTDVSGCVRNSACNWVAGIPSPCQAKKSVGCEVMRDAVTCGSSDMCMWDATLKFCLPTVTQCRFNDADSCTRVKQCSWRSGETVVQMASGMGADVALFNPGQPEIFVFPTLSFPSVDAATTYIDMASVMIETNYQVGKDKLDLSLPTSISIVWTPSSGTLQLAGNATVADYGNAISLVTFQTTSTAVAPRTITWALGRFTSVPDKRRVVYSAATGHSYISFSANPTTQPSGVSWLDARAACAATWVHGRGGYLATVTSQAENDVIATKLEGWGWLGADDSQGDAGSWRWRTGPNFDLNVQFWSGYVGGVTAPGMFSYWDPRTSDQPSANSKPGANAAWMTRNSYWHSQLAGSMLTNWVCEYGGLNSDMLTGYPIGGYRVLGTGGCLPSTCVWHVNEGNCTQDNECEWDPTSMSCKQGCLSRATAGECVTHEACQWDTTTTPATCQRNPCTGLGKIPCGLKPACAWQNTMCIMRVGCAVNPDEASCNTHAACKWYSNMGGCQDKECNDITDSKACGTLPKCYWDGGVCKTTLCQHTTQTVCETDGAGCMWKDPQSSVAGYFPNGPAVRALTGMGNYAPDDSETLIDGITIVITEGYHQGRDVLTLNKTNTMVRTTFADMWLPQTGALVLRAFPGAAPLAINGFRMAMDAVLFQTTSNRINRREFTVTLGNQAVVSKDNVNYVLKVVQPDTIVARHSDAVALCASPNNTFFGATGTLAEPRSQQQAMLVTAVGAQGWIGATGANSGAGGTTTGSNVMWTWDSDGKLFWQVVNGWSQPVKLPPANVTASASVEFASWAPGYPSTGAYAFQLVKGSWISVVDGTNQNPGVMCQYSLMKTTTPSVYGYAYASPQGCFVKPCVTLTEAACKGDTSCNWIKVDGVESCGQDSWCTTRVDPKACGQYAGCYWDNGLAQCTAAPATQCSGLAPGACANLTSCTWNSLLVVQPGATAAEIAQIAANGPGACVFKGCAAHPTTSSCLADPECRWYRADQTTAGLCVERLCGYTEQDQCWADSRCRYINGGCTTNECLGASQTDCNNKNPCQWDSARSVCGWRQCSSKLNVGDPVDFAKCLWDPSCLVSGGQCTKPTCNYNTETACNADKMCHYFQQISGGHQATGVCRAAQCVSYGAQTACPSAKLSDQCRWENGACRQASASEMMPRDVCVKQIDPNLTWLWVFLVFIFLILCGIMYRLYLAFFKGLNFFEPARKNVKFQGHSKYAAELYSYAQETAINEDAHAPAASTANDASYNAGGAGEYNEEEHPDL